MDEARVAGTLVSWYGRHGRALPWRATHDPYHILLSEFILQQTRMETGLRYFDKILRRFPTIRHLARARESTVLAAWSGLGYYRRARNLHAAARTIVRKFGAKVPDDASVLRTLPGIGPYTAGAIASIAYDRPEPSLDGNQFRVLGRLLGLSEPLDLDGRRKVEAFAWRLLRHGSPRILNQALMDLGSDVCTPTPRCDACPLAASCRGRGRLGSRRPRPARPPVQRWRALIHRRGGAVWLAEPRPDGLLAGLWLPPLVPVRALGAGPRVDHHFSHRTWRIEILEARTAPTGPGRWVRPGQLASLPHSRLTRRLLEAGAEPASPGGSGRGSLPSAPRARRHDARSPSA